MGTRSQIRIVKNGYPLNYYHHYDGGWNGVGEQLRKWLKEIGVDGGGKGMAGAEYIVLRMEKDGHYHPTFFRHGDIRFFYLLDFDEGVFNGYELKGLNPWAQEGEDGYDQHRPWYSQLPKQDSVIMVKGIVGTEKGG